MSDNGTDTTTPKWALSKTQEPSVLKRLRIEHDSLGMHAIDEGALALLLADAIADIERLEEGRKTLSREFAALLDDAGAFSDEVIRQNERANRLEAQLREYEEEAETSDMVLIDLQRKLNAYTDAEPVAVYTLQDDGEKRSLRFTDEKGVKIYHAVRLVKIAAARRTMPVDPSVQALCDEIAQITDSIRTGEHIYLFAQESPETPTTASDSTTPVEESEE